MAEKDNNQRGEHLPEPDSHEARRVRIAQLNAEHKKLNHQWRALIQEMRGLFVDARNKTSDQLKQEHQRLEILTGQMDEIHERQSALEAEIFGLWSAEDRDK